MPKQVRQIIFSHRELHVSDLVEIDVNLRVVDAVVTFDGIEDHGVGRDVEQVLRHRPDEGAVMIQNPPPSEDDVAFVLELVDRDAGG